MGEELSKKDKGKLDNAIDIFDKGTREYCILLDYDDVLEWEYVTGIIRERVDTEKIREIDASKMDELKAGAILGDFSRALRMVKYAKVKVEPKHKYALFLKGIEKLEPLRGVCSPYLYFVAMGDVAEVLGYAESEHVSEHGWKHFLSHCVVPMKDRIPETKINLAKIKKNQEKAVEKLMHYLVEDRRVVQISGSVSSGKTHFLTEILPKKKDEIKKAWYSGFKGDLKIKILDSIPLDLKTFKKELEGDYHLLLIDNAEALLDKDSEYVKYLRYLLSKNGLLRIVCAIISGSKGRVWIEEEHKGIEKIKIDGVK